MSLHDWIREFYINLLKDGWKLEEIEEIDIGWYLELSGYVGDKENRKQADELDAAGL